MNTTAPETAHAAKRQAVRETLAVADPTEIEARLRRFLETTRGGANEWDQRFLAFAERHRRERILVASAGGGLEIVFSPREASGYWLWRMSEGVGGKGFLGPHDSERILEIAREKNLVGS